MRFRMMLLAFMLAGSFPAARVLAQLQDAPMTSLEERMALHHSAEWDMIASHLPDPETSSAASLETAADVLRARRFPEDALDYYGYAMARGGNVSELLNKMGVVRLELQQNDLAHAMFQRTVRVQKKNAMAWNNLGVTEYVAKHYKAAVADYQRAAKLDRRSAIYHSNLGMTYLEMKDVESARQQFAVAIRLDPAIMQDGDSGGATMHVLSSDQYSELCFEMAKIYGRLGSVNTMRLWLAKASEGGFDVRRAMGEDVFLRPFLKDAQVQMLLANAAQLRSRNVAVSKVPHGVAVPSLGPSRNANANPNLDPSLSPSLGPDAVPAGQHFD